MPTKVRKIERLLERRIRHGDYILTEIPAERYLAAEMGSSRMTTRKAIEQLIQRGLLKRLPNGRLAIGDNLHSEQLTLGMLIPYTASGDVENWRRAAEQAGKDFNARIRTILYLHWDDPVIQETLSSFSSVFLMPRSEDIPPKIIEMLAKEGKSVSVLGEDLSMHGIHSVFLFPSFWVQRLLDHLAELGHRTIDCFNVQPEDVVIRGRLEQWQLWRAAHRLEGELFGKGIQSFEPPIKRAYDQMTAILKQGRLKATALFCTTAPAAVGVIRAMHDRGIKVGKDISVCTINDEGLTCYTCPSVTCIKMPDPTPYLRLCIERMLSSDGEWAGSLLLQPAALKFFKGESTGPVNNTTGMTA